MRKYNFKIFYTNLLIFINSEICHTDNIHKVADEGEFKDMIISSKMIIEKFGGIEKIANELKTDLKVSVLNFINFLNSLV